MSDAGNTSFRRRRANALPADGAGGRRAVAARLCAFTHARARRTGYRVLARKYRPSSFADLIGQEAMVRTLANAFATGRIPHAFMLTGVRGVGKTTTARILARALNYRCRRQAATARPSTSPRAGVPLPAHHRRRAMSTCIEMDAASHTGIDDIREIIDGVRYAPVSARYKVYIIDEVHMLSTAGLQRRC